MKKIKYSRKYTDVDLLADIKDRHNIMRDLAQIQLVRVQQDMIADNDVAKFWQKSEQVELTRIVTGCDQRLEVLERDYAALMAQKSDMDKG